MAIPWLLVAVIIAVIWAALVTLGLQGWARDELEEFLKKFDINASAATIDYSKGRNHAQSVLADYFGAAQSVTQQQAKIMNSLKALAKEPLTEKEADLVRELSGRVASSYNNGAYVAEIHLVLSAFRIV